MASSRIKGITVEIGGNTVGLQNALRDVNNRTKEVQSELKDVERLLKFNPNNVELLAQRQELLTQAIQSSTTKLNELRQAEAQVQAQFERGEISQEQYRGFRRELQQTEQQLQGFQQALQDMQTEQEQVGQRTRQMSALFDATGTSVEDYANVIGNRLVRAIQDGTATSRDLEYAFQRIGRQAIGSEGDIERLRQTLMTVDSGNSIQNIRRDLQQLQQEAEQTAESVDGIGESLQGVAGALVAGGGIAGSIEQALDVSSLDTKIEILFEVPESSKQSIKEAVRGIQAYGLDGEEALEGVRRQWALNKDASDEANLSISKGAAAIAKNFAGVDFIELIQETNEIASGLKISNQNALALVDSLLKAGFPPEQLDTIAEYGTQMQLAGFSLKEIQSIFEAGISTKTWNIDNLNDGVKEARLTMASFGLEIPAALAPLIDQAGMSQKKFQEWGKAVAAGGKEGSKAMSEVATWLQTIDNKELKNELATKVFGTKWEDQGDNMIAVFNGVATAADKTNENINGLYETVGKTNADPMVELQHAINNVRMAAEPALLVIADLISKIANWIAENPKLAATLVSITTATGIIIGAIMGLIPIVLAVVTTMKTFGITIGALATPIGWIVAAIAGLVTAGVLLYQNWDTIGKTAATVFESTKNTITNALSAIQDSLSTVGSAISNFAGPLIETVSSAFRNLGTTIMEVLNGDFAQLGEFFTMLLPSLIALMVGGIPGLIISAARFLPAIAEGMESNKGVLIETINGVVASIIEFLEVGLPQLVGTGLTIVLNLINGIVGALPGVIAVGVSLIQSLIEGIGTVLPKIITLAIEVVTSLVTSIAGALPKVINAGVGILNAVISGIISVLPLLIGAAVLLITSIVETLVKSLPKIISAGVDILTALIAGIIKILPSLVTTAVKLIVTIVSTLAENLPKIISTGIDVLEALITGIIKIIPTLIKTAINLVVQIVQAIVQNLPMILKAGKDILVALLEGIVSVVATLLTTVGREIVSPLIKQFKEIDLLQVGKDIIRGLVNGIGAMAGSIKAKVEELASNIPAWAKKILGIHSPSKVMADEVGQHIPTGIASGIKKTTGKAKAASEKAAKEAVAAAKKAFDGAMKTADFKFDTGKINHSQYIAELNKIRTTYAKTADQVQKVNLEIYKVEQDAKKKQVDLLKERFDEEKKAIDDRKYYNQLSLTQELSAWESLQKKYKAGTDQRTEADRNVYRVKQEINNELSKINSEYSQKIIDANQRMIDSEKALTAEYQKALDDRTRSLYGFAGLFDEINKSSEITGEQLLDNLKGQVETFSDWADNIKELAVKGIDEGLLEELRQMGPKAFAEIAALNSLSAEQLDLYVSLWKEKNAQAREQAESELEGLKTETQAKIAELRTATATELNKYKAEWVTKVKEIRTGATGEMNLMKDSMKDIGLNSIKGLMDGMEDMTGPLLAQARSIARAVTDTLKGALSIHSPSRVMRDEVGKWIPLGISEGILANMDSIVQASNKMASAAFPANTSGTSQRMTTQQVANHNGNIYVTIPMSDIKQMKDINDFFGAIRQANRSM